MINLNAFIKSLKTTWIRQILTSDSKWQEFIKEYVDLDKMVSCNIEYVRQKHTLISDQFWKDVLKAVIDTDVANEITKDSVLKSPINCNRNITINCTYIFF